MQYSFCTIYSIFQPPHSEEKNIVKDVQGLRRNFFIDCRCTVKSPNQSSMTTLISKCRSANKSLVVAGCVPQGSKNLKELEGVNVVGVQQIDRVVEVVEETLKGHDLPKRFFFLLI
jgi:tRNA A37 methylthiotransferase MiaB